MPSALWAYPEAAPNATKDVLGKGEVRVGGQEPAGGWRYAGVEEEWQRWAWLPDLQHEEVIDVKIPSPLDVVEG